MDTQSLDCMLDKYIVISLDDMDDEFMLKQSLTGWYCVANNDGIFAYFGNEADAFRFRLAEINRDLNG